MFTYIVTCNFFIEIVYFLLDFTFFLINKGYLKYVANAGGDWLLMKDAPPKEVAESIKNLCLEDTCV